MEQSVAAAERSVADLLLLQVLMRRYVDGCLGRRMLLGVAVTKTSRIARDLKQVAS